MKNLIWLVVAAVIALAGYMLFTGKGPQEVAIEASDAINAPAVAEEVTEAADAIADTVDAAGEAITEAVDDATESANDAAEPAVQN